MNNDIDHIPGLAHRIVKEILDKGLAESTWRDNFPEAYDALVHYRLDLEGSCRQVLRKHCAKTDKV